MSLPKERILEKASVLFHQQGYNSTGINQIIAEADIAIGSLYKHYQSKSDLLYHYLEQQETEYFANLDDYLKDEKQPLKKLLKLIDYRIKLQEESNFSGCHFQSARCIAKDVLRRQWQWLPIRESLSHRPPKSPAVRPPIRRPCRDTHLRPCQLSRLLNHDHMLRGRALHHCPA